MARIHTAREGARTGLKPVKERTFKRPSSAGDTAAPAVNGRPTTRFARKPPEGDCFGALSTAQTGAKLKLRHYRALAEPRGPTLTFMVSRRTATEARRHA